MVATMQATKYNIGWDVRGWNCDKNPRSRDAIVILDSDRRIHGAPWRGNLREQINRANTTSEWVKALFELCEADHSAERLDVVLAINTPLGFSAELVSLAASRQPYAGALREHSANPYIFRQTERLLFRDGFTPLSPVKDIIGRQATKGMHVLAKFAPNLASCGVWTGDKSLTVIETYPAARKHSATMSRLRGDHEPLDDEDEDDALTCALAANLFSEQGKQSKPLDEFKGMPPVPPIAVHRRRSNPFVKEMIRDRKAGRKDQKDPLPWDALENPPNGVPDSEGWIWVPIDVKFPRLNYAPPLFFFNITKKGRTSC